MSFNSDGTILAIGAIGNDGNGTNSGRARIYQYSNSAWNQLGNDIDGEDVGDQSGWSMSLNSDGTIVAIGAVHNDGNGNDSGHTRIYQYNSSENTWNKIGDDIDGDAPGDQSGFSVSLNSEGRIVAIGAIYNDGIGNMAGHTKIYQYSNSTWTQMGDDIEGETTGNRSGYSVSLNSAGTIVAIGAGYNDDNGNDSGHTRIYQYNGSQWEQIGQDIDGEAHGDRSGESVSLNSNGTIVAIGAIGSDDNGNNSGHTRIYEYDGSANRWDQIGQDIDGEATNDRSGFSVSLNSDGTIVAIGAQYSDDNGNDSGHARIYQYNGSIWNQLGLDIDGEAANDRSGYSVSLNGNGRIVAIGAINNDGDQGALAVGHVRVYQLVDNTVPTLQLTGDAIVSVSQGDVYIDQGARIIDNGVDIGAATPSRTVDISTPGGYTITYNGVDAAGNAATSITRTVIVDPMQYLQIGQDIDGEDPDDRSGYSVSFNSNGTIVAIGAPQNDVNGENSGHVRIYQYNGSANRWEKIGEDINGDAAGDRSGHSVSLNGAGTRVAIGAVGSDGNGAQDSGRTRIYEYNGDAWTQVGNDINGEAAGDQSGHSVSLNSHGTRVAVGAMGNRGIGRPNNGHVRIYEYTGSTWEVIGQDLDGVAAGDQAGSSVSFNSEGTIVAIGSRTNDSNGNASGHTRIYEYNGNIWEQVGLNINGENVNDESGFSVSLNSNGTIVAIGAPFNDDNENDSGHTRIYQYNGSQWEKIGQDIDGEAANDRFGTSVSLDSSGTMVAIGATGTSSIGPYSGYVRIYSYDGSAWNQVGEDINGESAHTTSGHSVSLNGNGTMVAIGAPLNSDNGNYSGHVRVYQLTRNPVPRLVLTGDASVSINVGDVYNDPGARIIDNGVDIGLATTSLPDDFNTNTPGTYTITYNGDDAAGNAVTSITRTVIVALTITETSRYLQIGQNIDGEASGDLFGGSVSLNSDGTIVAIGGRNNDGNGDNSGHIRIYQYSNSAWNQLGGDIDGENGGDTSGYSVALNGNGTIVAIGAISNNGNGDNSGHARIYQYNGSANTWEKIGNDIDGEAEGDMLGYSVSLNSDGTIVAIGSRNNDDGGNGSGHVRIYQYSNSAWNQLGDDIDGEADADNSGFSVSLDSSGTIVAIGAILNDDNGESSGHVRIYQYNGSANTWEKIGEDIDGEDAGDLSGYSVSLNGNGTIVAIGAMQNDGNGGNSGHTRIYSYNGTIWSKIGEDIDGEAINDRSGFSVSLNNDGTIVAIGSQLNDGNGESSGHARIYHYNGNTWSQIGPDLDGEFAGDQFGISVSLNSAGTIVAIGALHNDVNGDNSGHVRVYQLTN